MWWGLGRKWKELRSERKCTPLCALSRDSLAPKYTHLKKKCKEKKNFWEIVIKIFLSKTKFFFLETFLYRSACFLVLSNYKFGVSSEGIDSIIIYILQTGLLLVPWAYTTFSFSFVFFFFCYSQIETESASFISITLCIFNDYCQNLSYRLAICIIYL